MKNSKLKNSLITATFITMLAGGITPAMAVSSRFSFGPTYPDLNAPEILHYELKPGDSVNGSVTVTNKEETPGTFTVYPADTEYNQNLHLVYKEKGSTRSLASAWIAVDENSFILKPNEKRDIPFTLDIPKDAGISDAYTAGIVLEKTIETEKTSSLKYRAALVIPVELKVTMNPEHIAKYGEVDIFKTYPTLWISIALFLGGIGYFIYGHQREKLAKTKQTTDISNTQP